MSQPTSAQSPALESRNSQELADRESRAIATTRVSGASSVATEADRFSIEQYADQLMDELFSDLHEALEQGRPVSTELPEELAASRTPTPVSVTDVTIPPVLATVSQAQRQDGSTNVPDAGVTRDPTFVPELNPEPALIPQFDQSSGQSSVQSSGQVAVDSSPEDELVAAALMPRPTGVKHKSLDGLLALLVCGSLAAAVALWYAMQGRWQQANAPDTAGSSEVATQPASPENREFLDYIQRSLRVLEQRSARRQAETAGTEGNLPSVAVAGNPAATNSAPTDPLIVPVYRPPADMALPGRSGGNSSGSSGGSSGGNGFPSLPGFNLPGRSPAVSTVPLPTTAPAAPSAASSTDSTTDTPAAAPNIAAVSTHTLVGVLELSDPARSAALFEINGTTHRVQVGEPIGASGWTLVSVKGNEVMVRRNGDVRSIYTGQQF
ncbi:hypothetical protein HPC62_10025 [Thermoleptolyngbya sichuanensis A183]|uniref:Type II secretion system protein GspC N-terminal domain-containing protein n=1 Tax=Thermoleptolyngbya sichuanensis A183 TaxID=2737172 RepID=A0A6M8BDW2_9CYAN|nr:MULTISPECIES: hypothetical protein [Thermoleptolyngbya]QKD82470.1 hypothetical protein HPC62_10025 [Thermoleptolyngbya sichuanensis A183]